MNKLFILSLIVILGAVSFVSAINWAGEGAASFNKGWNLIYGFISPDQIQALEQSHIKAIYAFIPTTQKYVRLYPNRDVNALKDLDIDDLITQSALWVYSDKAVEGTFNGLYRGGEYWLYELPLPYTQLPRYNGWNFVGITSEMIGKTFNNMKGDCKITKIYFWDAQTQSWNARENLLNIEIPKDIIGQGMLIQVSNDCQLGESGTSGSLATPPALPSGETSCSSFNFKNSQCEANGCICEGPDCRVCWPSNSDTICKDSDNGLNYFVKGTTGTGANPIYTDFCPTNDVQNTLVEYTCHGKQTGVVSNYYICPNGCKDGACIA